MTAPSDVRSDVEFLRDLVARVQRRIDPHAFHFVLWGAIVLAWYPLSNWLQSQERFGAMTVVGAVALVLGGVGSALLEARRKGRTRVEGEDPSIGGRVGWVAAANVGAAIVLSVLAPAAHFVEGRAVPVLWGLAYASMAFHVGILYSREFVWSGAAIFAGACAAMCVPDVAGYVLGPVMGLGMIVPGWIAERRVQRMRREDVAHGAGVA